jgi:ABC-type uncharacterized transport system ATPase subunit
MSEERIASRRQVLRGGIVAAAGVVAGAAITTSSPEASAAENLVKTKMDRAKFTQQQVEKDKIANQAAQLLKKIDPNIEIQWADGAKLPGGRRIVQLWG